MGEREGRASGVAEAGNVAVGFATGEEVCCDVIEGVKEGGKEGRKEGMKEETKEGNQKMREALFGVRV